MTLTANQQTELERPVTRIAYFAEFQFATATVYTSSLNQTITWGGHDWLGVGTVGSVSAVEEKQGTAAQALTFKLNLADASILSLSVMGVEEYRGLPAKLYFCPMDEQFRLVDTPVICWRGTMDTMSTSISGERGNSQGQVVLKCETSAYGLKRRPNLRLNAAQHRQRMIAQGLTVDTGFDYLTDLIANTDKWLSIKFQTI
jgi:hypothetical protein